MLLNDPWNNIYSYPLEFTSNLPNTLEPGYGGNDASALIFGDFSHLLIGQSGAPSTLVDPFSGSKAGTIRIVLHTEIDIRLRHAVSFDRTDKISIA